MQEHRRRWQVVKIKLKEVAEPMGWTPARLARRADLANGTVYGIWNGTIADPGIQTLGALAGALGVSVCELLQEEASASADENIDALEREEEAEPA
jgi:transcriptional regulator with XRE-family HTH domain